VSNVSHGDNRGGGGRGSDNVVGVVHTTVLLLRSQPGLGDLSVGSDLCAREAIGHPDATSSFFEVVDRPLEDGVFVCHEENILTLVRAYPWSLFCSDA